VNADDLDLLTKLLGMLGSEHAGERDAAALAIERLRQRTGKTWAELLQAAPRGPRIVINRWEPQAPIFAQGGLPDGFDFDAPAK
jgi:hypothetical protein